MSKPCPCGSGLPRRDLIRCGMYRTVCCDKCEGWKREYFQRVSREQPTTEEPTEEPTTPVGLTRWELATIRVMIAPHLAAGTFPKRFVPMLRRLAEKLEAA